MTLKIVSIGEATADFYPTINKTLVGGISLNFAVHAKRCGVETVALITAVGQDAHGQLILAKLAQEGVDASHVAVLAGKTAHCEIVVLENGERYFPPNSYHQHVLATFALTPADLTFIQQHDVLVSRFDISYTKTMFNQVMQTLDFRGKRVADFGDWFDYEGRHDGIASYLEQIDLAFISGDQETITAVSSLPASKTQWVVTLGAEGSVAFCDGKLLRQPAIPVEKIVDTTGCGDAFQAAFTAVYFQNPHTTLSDRLKASLAAGAQNAAQTLTHFGAI